LAEEAVAEEATARTGAEGGEDQREKPPLSSPPESESAGRVLLHPTVQPAEQSRAEQEERGVRMQRGLVRLRLLQLPPRRDHWPIDEIAAHPPRCPAVPVASHRRSDRSTSLHRTHLLPSSQPCSPHGVHWAQRPSPAARRRGARPPQPQPQPARPPLPPPRSVRAHRTSGRPRMCPHRHCPCTRRSDSTTRSRWAGAPAARPRPLRRPDSGTSISLPLRTVDSHSDAAQPLQLQLLLPITIRVRSLPRASPPLRRRPPAQRWTRR